MCVDVCVCVYIISEIYSDDRKDTRVLMYGNFFHLSQRNQQHVACTCNAKSRGGRRREWRRRRMERKARRAGDTELEVQYSAARCGPGQEHLQCL